MYRQRTTIFSVLFWILTVILVGLALFYVFAFFSSNVDSDDIVSEIKWKNIAGAEADPENLSEFVLDENNSFTVYFEVPNSAEIMTLAFKSSFVDVSVLLNGKTVYSSELENSDIDCMFALPALAPCLNYVDFDKLEQGDIISLNVRIIDNRFPSEISEITYGEKTSVLSFFTGKSAVFYFACIIMFAIGFVLLIFHIAFKRIIGINGLKYAAFYAFFSAVCIFTGIAVSPQIIGENNLRYYIHCSAYAMEFLPLVLFFSENVKSLACERALKILSIIQTLIIAAFSAFMIVKAEYFSVIMPVMQAAELISCIYILVVLFIDFANLTERTSNDLVLATSFMVFFLFMFLGEMLNSEVLILISALYISVYIMIITIKNLSVTLELTKQTKAIGKLAYTDSMTGAGNTAAFKKEFDHLEVVKINYKTIGIVQFDINNLKYVNDNLGHDMGDKLITDGSMIIMKTFGKIGNVYRVGGDEFCAVIHGENTKAACAEAAEKFEIAIADYNSNESNKFNLQIAYGIEYYYGDGENRDMRLKEIQKLADAKMYDKKRKMKENNKYNARKE